MKDRKFPNLNPEYEHLVLVVEPVVKKKKRVSITDESIFKPSQIADEYKDKAFTNAIYDMEIANKLKQGKK